MDRIQSHRILLWLFWDEIRFDSLVGTCIQSKVSKGEMRRNKRRREEDGEGRARKEGESR